jgi:ornithine cyclodeaminase
MTTTDPHHSITPGSPGPGAIPPFAVISGSQIQRALAGREAKVVELIGAAYRSHSEGDSVNPPSYFLRFPDRPTARIIALPASLGGRARIDGLKWVSSFPDNVAAGIPRASAVLILNDHDTGYPVACLEGSIINATRTAASAALAAAALTVHRPRPTRVGFFGLGLIARYIHTYLSATGWSFDEIGVHDLNAAAVEGFSGYLRRSNTPARVVQYRDPEQLIRSSDLVVFATVAAKPHVHDATWLDHNPLILHISLRDLAPQIVLAATNIVDDVDHCLRESTSVHLAAQLSGNRGFLAGTLAEAIAGRVALGADTPVVFSPFGLGVLDLAVGKYVYDLLAGRGDLEIIDDFFHEVRRYG